MTPDEIEREIKLLKSKRITQVDIVPGAVKMRAISEGVPFVRSGATADLPTEGESTMQGAAIYFDETTNKLYIWNKTDSLWKEIQLS
jgi:hypothetical protein